MYVYYVGHVILTVVLALFLDRIVRMSVAVNFMLINFVMSVERSVAPILSIVSNVLVRMDRIGCFVRY